MIGPLNLSCNETVISVKNYFGENTALEEKQSSFIATLDKNPNLIPWGLHFCRKALLYFIYFLLKDSSNGSFLLLHRIIIMHA